MEPFNSIVIGLNTFKDKIEEIALNAIIENKQSIISINIDRIFREGKNSEGIKITRNDKPYDVYSSPYEMKKRSLGLYQGFIDLSLSGKYLDSYDLKIEGSKIRITSNRNVNGFNLSEYLPTKYNDIEGLSDEEWFLIAKNIIVPMIYNELLKAW